MKKVLKISILSPMLCSFLLLGSCNDKLGVFEQSMDIGNPALQGNTTFQQNEYNLTGGGYNIWFDRDEFHYAFKEVKGDFKLRTQLGFNGEGKDPHRKVGIMVREDTDANASHITATLHGDGLTVLQWRVEKGMEMRDPEDEIFAENAHYEVLELERIGQNFIMRGAMEQDGILEIIGEHTMSQMPEQALVGIFICSHNPEVLEQGWFRDLVLETE